LPGGAAVRFRREIRLGKTGLLLTIKAGRNAALPGRRHSPSIAWKIRSSESGSYRRGAAGGAHSHTPEAPFRSEISR